MPLKSGGTVDNEHVRGRSNSGLISIEKIRALPQGTYLSTAVTPSDFSNFSLVRGSGLRRSFWHDGYAYIFFVEATTFDVIYNSTHDGTTWTKPSTGNPVATRAERGNVDWGYNIDVLYDGVNVYIVVAESVVNGVVKTKKGTISAGTITWGSWITIVSAAQDTLEKNNVSLTKTVDGYFWIAYANCTATNYFTIYCVRSVGNSIDSWGSPILIKTPVATGFRNVCVLPLSASSVFICYSPEYNAVDYKFKGKTFDGTTVGSEEIISSMHISNDRAWSAVNDVDNNILVIYQQSTSPYTIWLRKRGSGISGSWGSEIQTPITTNVTQWANGFSLTRTGTPRIYIFYNEESATHDPYYRFYYRAWHPTTGFGSAVEVTTVDEEMVANFNQEICSNYELQTGTLIGMWFRTTGPPSPLRCVIVSGLS